jgi:hypothetical protein
MRARSTAASSFFAVASRIKPVVRFSRTPFESIRCVVRWTVVQKTSITARRCTRLKSLPGADIISGSPM